MDIILASNATLQARHSKKPSVSLMEGEPTVQFTWGIYCFPEVVPINAVSCEVAPKLAKTAGELLVRLDVWFFGDEPCGRMVVIDKDAVVKKIFVLLKKKSYEMVVRIEFFDNILSFSGFDFVEAHLKNNTDENMIEYAPQRLSPLSVLSLLSDDLQQEDLRATIRIRFSKDEASL